MKTQKAFTLVELMVVVAVAAILLGLAVPSFNTMIQNNRLTSQANEFVASMNLARSEAVKRGVDVKIGDPDASDGNDEWEGGWNVWIDTNDNDQVDAGEEELRVVAAFKATTTLDRLADNQADEDQDDFTYRPDGTLRLITPDSQTLDLCDSGSTDEDQRQISIAPSGRISSRRISSADPNYTCP